MGWKTNSCRNPEEKTRILLAGVEGEVAARLYAGPPYGYVPIMLDGEDYPTLAHFAQLEIFEPEPPTPEYQGTDYYQESATGALYKRIHSVEGWHFVCINQARLSVRTNSVEIPDGFKRLFREV